LRDIALNAGWRESSHLLLNSELVDLASGKERVKYPDRIPVSGKTPELRKSPKNKVSRKVSQKFSKIINII